MILPIPQNMTFQKVSNLNYLTETMHNRKHLILEIINIFLSQLPEELNSLNEAVRGREYERIKTIAHTMKSTFSVMSVTSAGPILSKLEHAATAEAPLAEISILLEELNELSTLTIVEINNEKGNYA